jgi:hypothetical protein
MGWTEPDDVVMVIAGQMRVVSQEEAARREAALTPAQRALRDRIMGQFEREAEKLRDGH